MTELVARIAPPEARPAMGTKVVEQVSGDLSLRLVKAGYEVLDHGDHEVIRLQDVEEVRMTLTDKYGGLNALHRMTSEDFRGLRKVIGKG